MFLVCLFIKRLCFDYTPSSCALLAQHPAQHVEFRVSCRGSDTPAPRSVSLCECAVSSSVLSCQFVLTPPILLPVY